MSDRYENPLCSRYSSKDMQFIFSSDNKFTTWRKLWLALAQSQKELGLDITDEQINELKAHLTDINYDVAREKEALLRHDVMAHIHAYAELCPKAKPIIHLGATSSYVGDNTDIIVQKSALSLIKKLLINTIDALYKFADKYKDLPTLAYTHFQAAQPTTVGKRASLWLQDLVMDLELLDFTIERLKLLGCRGTTGTSASFLALFDGDEQKVIELEKKIAEKMGFNEAYSVSGQTYTRKIDYYVSSVLCSIAQSAQKFSNDIRLLAHLKEVDEPFEQNQVGSSAMAYKKNPMRSERICALSRYTIVNTLNPALTAASQWFERTLDDSANKRIATPEAFLAVDAILSLYINIIGNLAIYPKVIEKHLEQELPFIATENILMYCVKKGGDRQELHEKIRQHSLEAAKQVKLNGLDNDLIERIANDKSFNLSKDELADLLDAKKFTGRATHQVQDFLLTVKPIIEQNKNLIGIDISIKV